MQTDSTGRRRVSVWPRSGRTALSEAPERVRRQTRWTATTTAVRAPRSCSSPPLTCPLTQRRDSTVLMRSNARRIRLVHCLLLHVLVPVPVAACTRLAGGMCGRARLATATSPGSQCWVAMGSASTAPPTPMTRPCVCSLCPMRRIRPRRGRGTLPMATIIYTD